MGEKLGAYAYTWLQDVLTSFWACPADTASAWPC